MQELSVDLVVIGSGPSGQKAAIQAAKLGKKVIVVEKSCDPGGFCVYSGTIPSKTFREAVMNLTRFYERSFIDAETILYEVNEQSIQELNHRLQKVIDEEKSLVYRQLRKNGITLIQGEARFENPHMLLILDGEGRLTHQIKSDYFVIATGSKPRNPKDVPFDNEVILDSTSLLGIERVPKSMIVLGGGIIGSEYASFFAALGTEVTVVDKRDHMLPLLDAEIGVHLQTALTDIGLTFLGNRQPAEIARVDGRAYVKFTDGSSLTGDVLLYALGRTANVDSLNIVTTGIERDQKGYLVVNTFYQTSIPHIYAVGDVIGGASLASTSMEQGRQAALHICGNKIQQLIKFYPVGIYTIPEISSFGYNEEDLKEKGIHYEVGRAYYYELARSHIAGSNTGLFKILFHAETLEILGVHVIGRSATEVIHIGQIAITFNAKIDYFVDHVFNYPTYAEGYRVAALNGINKIKSGKYVKLH